MTALAHWFSERIPLDPEALRELTNEPVPNHMKRWWFCLGGTPAYLFVVQIVTGILLAIYYQPSAATAYESVEHITRHVALRLVLPQPAQVGGDADDRRRHPAPDAGLFHRRVSPAARVELGDRHVPVADDARNRLHRLQPGVRAAELLGRDRRRQHRRPGAARRQLGQTVAAGRRPIQRRHTSAVLHPARGRPARHADGACWRCTSRSSACTASPNWSRQRNRAPRRRHFNFFPDHFYTELIIGLVLMILLSTLATLLPATMGPKADPLTTPEVIKPEWFFYVTFRWLKLFGPTFAVLSMGFIVFAMFVWPWIDTASADG